MISMTQSKSCSHAMAYFKGTLLRSDHYIHVQAIQGQIYGRIAERLGLERNITQKIFQSLCENLNPITATTLTQRTLDQRTVAYDISFHCPKSVSIAHVFFSDGHILETFRRSVEATMLDIEFDSKTRIRKNGQYDDRQTRELIWAEFIHETTVVNDASKPEPHLHAHCFTFNVTWDDQEKLFKAVQFRDIMRDMPYYEARFHKRLADNLSHLGYSVKLTDKFFEIEGVDQHAIDSVIKSTDELRSEVKIKRKVTDNNFYPLRWRTTSKKRTVPTLIELKEQWISQIKAVGSLEANDLRQVDIKYRGDQHTAQHYIDYAIKCSFERVSIMQERRLLEIAYRQALGERTTLDAITNALRSNKLVIELTEQRQLVYTTREVLEKEKRIIDLTNQGKGKVQPLYLHPPRINLDGRQYAAIRHILTTSHRVSIIPGWTPSVKIAVMNVVTSLINDIGKKVIVIKPQTIERLHAPTSRTPKDTIILPDFLLDNGRQHALDGQVLWVNDAGLLGMSDMARLLDLATKCDARLILSGDTRQHPHTIRGDALRILDKVEGLRTSQVRHIFQQRNIEYQEAMEKLSHGQANHAFALLAKLGAIKTVKRFSLNTVLAEDYVKTLKKGKSAKVFLPTQQQAEEIAKSIRNKLRRQKVIGRKEIIVNALSIISLTETEKKDVSNYFPGQIIQFSQHVKGFRRGSTWRIQYVGIDYIQLANPDKSDIRIAVTECHRINVFKNSEIKLSVGDKIQITRNGFDANKKRLNRGQVLDIVSVPKNGDIKVRNSISKAKYALRRNYGHIAYANSITGYDTEIAKVDEVFIAHQPATLDTNLDQFYNLVTKGREFVHIYTEDKEVLFTEARKFHHNPSAIEFVEDSE